MRLAEEALRDIAGKKVLQFLGGTGAGKTTLIRELDTDIKACSAVQLRALGRKGNQLCRACACNRLQLPLSMRNLTVPGRGDPLF